MAEFKFNQWIKDNNFTNIQTELQKYNITDIDSFSVDSNKFQNWFLNTELKSNQQLMLRIIKAMHQTQYIQNQLRQI